MGGGGGCGGADSSPREFGGNGGEGDEQQQVRDKRSDSGGLAFGVRGRFQVEMCEARSATGLPGAFGARECCV